MSSGNIVYAGFSAPSGAALMVCARYCICSCCCSSSCCSLARCLASPPQLMPQKAALVVQPIGALVEQLAGDPYDRAVGRIDGRTAATDAGVGHGRGVRLRARMHRIEDLCTSNSAPSEVRASSKLQRVADGDGRFREIRQAHRRQCGLLFCSKAITSRHTRTSCTCIPRVSSTSRGMVRTETTTRMRSTCCAWTGTSSGLARTRSLC